MQLSDLTFLFSGIELSFFSGVYSPSIGFTRQMGSNVKQLVGLSGIFIGVGEVVGMYGSMKKVGSVILVMQFISYLLTYSMEQSPS